MGEVLVLDEEAKLKWRYASVVMAPHCCEPFCADFEETVLIPNQLSFRVGTEPVFPWPPEVCIVDESFARAQDVDGKDGFDTDLCSLILMALRHSVVCCVAEQWHVRHDFSL